MDKKTQFKSPMFVYAAETVYCPSKLKVFIPEVFLTGTSPDISEYKAQKGNTSIFLNATVPALSSYVTKYNYITLPIIRDNGGWVEKGTRFMAEFINTAIEYVVDLASPKIHPLAKAAKDTASAGVLMMAIIAAVIGCVIFLPKVITFVGGLL